MEESSIRILVPFRARTRDRNRPKSNSWTLAPVIFAYAPAALGKPRESCGFVTKCSNEYVLREAQSPLRSTLDKALADIGIERVPVAMAVGSTDTIVEMLGRGRYLSFLPSFAVEAALEAGELYHLKIQGLRIMRTLWIARTRSNLNNPVADAFIPLLRGVPRCRRSA